MSWQYFECINYVHVYKSVYYAAPSYIRENLIAHSMIIILYVYYI